MDDAEDVINFDQCPIEKITVYINGYAEVRRKATIRLNLGQISQPANPRPATPLSPLFSKTQATSSNRGASPCPSVRPPSNTVSTRRHGVVIRGLPGACLSSDSLRIELLEYRAPTPVSLDDVQLVYQKRKPNEQSNSKFEASATMLLEQKSLRDQLAHVRRRYESVLSRKHRLLAQRAILDRVADTMSRGASPLRVADIYGASTSIYADMSQLNAVSGQQQQHQPSSSISDTYRHLSAPGLAGADSNSFVPSVNFIDALQGFLQLYDDRTHKVDDNLADTNVELETLEDQLNHLSSLCSEADMRAPSPHLLHLTFSHFVLHNYDDAHLVVDQRPTSPTNNQAIVMFSITYTIYGAFWNPAYELRLRPDDSAVQLVYSVAITQSTGEDWLFEREGDDDTTCTRLIISTSRATVSPAAPSAPSPEKIYVRRNSATSFNRQKADSRRSRTLQRKSSNNSKNKRTQSQNQQQAGISTPNLLAQSSDNLMRAQTPDKLLAGAPRPLSMYSYAGHQPQHSPYNVIFNETHYPDALGPHYSSPIKHASSFATFVTPGLSTNTLAQNTGDYDNDMTYAVANGPTNEVTNEDIVPPGLFFEADVTSAAVDNSPKIGRGVRTQYVNVTTDKGTTVEPRNLVVKVPTTRSNLTPSKFVVGCHDLDVLSLSYEATPRMASSAFARAHLRNTSPLPLLAGSVAVFHDRASGSALFAYRTHLPYVAIGDDFLVALGPDPAVSIDYQAPQRRSMFGGLSTVKMNENLEYIYGTNRNSRSRSHDMSMKKKGSMEHIQKISTNSNKWSFYRQIIGISNQHERAIVKVHVVEPLPRTADKNLRLVLEAPVLQKIDRQVDDSGKKIRSSRKSKNKSAKGESFAARLNSSHQLEWDLTLLAGETKYLEIRYSLELKSRAEKRAAMMAADSSTTPLLNDAQLAEIADYQPIYARPTPLHGLSMPQPGSNNPSRSGSPTRARSPSNTQHLPPSGYRNTQIRPSSCYQIQPILSSSQLPQYRAAIQQRHPEEQLLQVPGLRYTSC